MLRRPFHHTRLSVERLEARETPASGLWLSESFDTGVVGSPPDGWATWGSNGNAGFAVAEGRAVSGRSVFTAGGSVMVARAWPHTAFPANVTTTAAVWLDSLIPAQVIARGRKLDGTGSTYYAASVVRGLEVKLLRVEGGNTTEFGAIKSATYLSGVWVDLTLMTQGDRLQARLQRRDTGEWLNRFGTWQPNPAVALDTRDSRIAGPGHVGLARPGSYAGTVSFDDVRVGPAQGDINSPTITVAIRNVNSPVRPNTFAGNIRFYAGVRDASRVDRVEFLVDGALIARQTAAPFRLDFETQDVSNGKHTLAVRAWDAPGNVAEVTTSFEVDNQIGLAKPAVPRHYNHIRYAALAYNGTPIGPAEESLLRNSIDLLAPHTRYLDRIEQAAPATPQLIYSNISNLYLDLLTDWLNFADRKGLSREAAFYHVAKATSFVGDSPSSQPVNWFWNVQRGPTAGSAGFTKLTSESRTGNKGDVRFGSIGEAIYLGYPERFREVNLTTAQAGAMTWSGVLEYPTAVDTAGRPVGWKAIKVASDTTRGLRLSGRVTFDPPADWKPALVSGSAARLFYVRIRTITGDASFAPVASRILGRDYVNANGARAGTIPAFDVSADANRDGYLTDAEYARRKSGFDARFVYESRMLYPFYGQMRFVTNPSGAGVSAWALDYHRRLLASQPKADGVFMDNSGGKAPTNQAVLVEPIDTYATAYAAVLGAVNRGISPKWVLANTSGGGADADRVVRQVPGTIEEFALRPLAHSWSQFHDLANTVARRMALTDPSGYLILDALSTGGSPTDPRTRLAALAYYYLLADPDSTFFMAWGGEEPASSWSRHWFNAIAFDVGRPKGGWSELTSGADPTNAALTYRIFQRAYDNALVVYKPLSYATGKGAGGRDDRTATTHSLAGNFRQLNADRTLGPVVNSVTLRNGEGAILICA